MSRRTTHLGASAIVLACALAGTLVTAGPASADSRGFKIYNLSSHPLKLVKVQALAPGCDPRRQCTDKWEGRPLDGAVLMPGAPPHDWELKWELFGHYEAHLTYDVVGTDSVYKATLDTSTLESDSDCTVGVGKCTAEGLTLTVTDPPGTVHDIPSGRAQEQAETLKDLCNKTNTATCTFTPVSETKTQTQAHIVGVPVANCKPPSEVHHPEDDAHTKITQGDKVGQTNSIEISSTSEFNVFEIVKESIALKYGHTWTTEHTFMQDVDFTIVAGHMGWLAGTAPVVRDRGDFKLTLGTTTWWLRDVYFDTPDPDGNGHWAPDDRAMSQEDREAQCPHGASDGLQRVPHSYVPMDWKGTGRADTLLGGPESHTVRGFAGNDLIRGGGGHDTLYGGRGHDSLDGGPGREALDGGRGNDILDGGPGSDTLDGGPGADTMIDNRGPTLVEIGPDRGPGTDTVDVRDGRGDDTVFCGSRGSTVVVDAGDSAIGPCGKVSRSGPN